MRVFVYGTLKSGYGNNRILVQGGATLVEENKTLPGYRLWDCGFPVAQEDEDSQITGEIWDIGNPEKEDRSRITLERLDALEGEGRMYNRVRIEKEDFSLYVGHPSWWKGRFGDSLRLCFSEESDDKMTRIYTWKR